MSYAISLVGVTPLGIFTSQSANICVGNISASKINNFLHNRPLLNEFYDITILVFIEFLIQKNLYLMGLIGITSSLILGFDGVFFHASPYSTS